MNATNRKTIVKITEFNNLERSAEKIEDNSGIQTQRASMYNAELTLNPRIISD